VSARRLIKAVVERGAIVSGSTRASRDKHCGATLVLAYHNIVPTGEQPAGDRSLHLAQAAFAQQLDSLLSTHTVVSLRDALTMHAGESANADRPRVVITFDDAYHGAMTAGIYELRRRGLPATIFVAPGRLGGRSFWWDTLSGPASGLSPTLREHALQHTFGREDDVMRWARDERIPIFPVPEYATSADTTLLQHVLDTHSGITYGAHTWTHPNLNTLDAATLHEELTKPLAWLEPYGKRAIPAIAYPYGLANESVHRAAEEAGYIAGFMISGGWMRGPLGARYALPRLNVPAGVSDAGFEMRTSGLITH
jgi:peptidoglycan/xylan/chitin deacetylase (PgdA/CDA1 family)